MSESMPARSSDYLLNEAALVLSEVEDYVWDGSTLPVPIESIAEDHFGLLIREVVDIAAELGAPDLPERQLISGALIPETAEIWVDATEASRWPRRRRYTIAHEIGHWVLHRGPEKVHCREAAVDPVDVVTDMHNSSAESWAGAAAGAGPAAVEWEANVFGGALLLPPWLVREAWDEHHSVEAIAEGFDCSLSAVQKRWQMHYSFIGHG